MQFVALGCFLSPKVGPLPFKPVFLGPPFAKSQKMRDLDVLSEFFITRLCGHFWSRRSRRKVVRCLHFNRSLIRLWSHLPRCVFLTFKFGLDLRSFSPPPLSKISENAPFAFLCQIYHTLALWALLEPPFAPKCCL